MIFLSFVLSASIVKTDIPSFSWAANISNITITGLNVSIKFQYSRAYKMSNSDQPNIKKLYPPSKLLSKKMTIRSFKKINPEICKPSDRANLIKCNQPI